MLPTEFFKLNAYRLGVHSVVEETTNFAFGGRGNDFFHDVRLCKKESAIGRRRRVVGWWYLLWVCKLVTEEEVPTTSRSTFRFGKVGVIAVNPQLHVTC